MKRIKQYDNLIMIIAILAIVSYIAFQLYSVTHIDLKTQTAVTTTVYESYDTKALFIRDEQVVNSKGGAINVPALNDGDKVGVGGNIAVTFSSSDDATAYSKYNDVMSQLHYYESLESQTMGQAANVEKINDQINVDVDKYIRATYSNKSVDTASADLNSSLVQRQMIIGESVDFSSITQELRKQAQEYNSSAKSAGYIKASESGVFTSYTDGYENIVDYSKATEQTIDSVKKAIKSVAKSEKTSSTDMGKLIKSYSWYMELVVPADKLVDYKNGDIITVALKNNDDIVLDMTIVSGAEPDVGAKETLLILNCNEMDSQLASLRVEDVEIRFNSYTGIKVPREALHVVDNNKGVYALISSQIRFRTADVIYSEEDWVLLSYDKNNSDGIHLYDKIIIKGKDLEDGKVYT